MVRGDERRETVTQRETVPAQEVLRQRQTSRHRSINTELVQDVWPVWTGGDNLLCKWHKIMGYL